MRNKVRKSHIDWCVLNCESIHISLYEFILWVMWMMYFGLICVGELSDLVNFLQYVETLTINDDN